MRVVQFLGSTGWGGLEKVFVTLCNELSKSIYIDVIIFNKSAVADKFDKNINIHLLYANPSRLNPLLYIELHRLLKKLNPDIVHTHGAKSTQIFYYTNKVLGISHIATKHNSRKGKIFNKLQNVIAVSKGVRKSIKNENVKVIYNGINPVRVFSQSKNEVFTLLAVGRLDKIKGFDILIEECSKLDFKYCLEIVGEGEEKRNLEDLISKLNLQEKVMLLGFREDIPQLMKNADIVVMSSHSEGFSLVMVESFFYGNLFISTKVSGATEILDERFLFDGFHFSEKINDIYENYEEYKKDFFSIKNKYVNKFLLPNVANETMLLYKKIKEKQCI